MSKDGNLLHLWFMAQDLRETDLLTFLRRVERIAEDSGMDLTVIQAVGQGYQVGSDDPQDFKRMWMALTEHSSEG